MASNQHTGINPLSIPRVDATQSGINSAFATVSREIAERTPRESLSTGSLQTGSGKFSVPATSSEQVRPRHAFHAVVYMDAADSSTVKANFQAAYVITASDGQIPVFQDDDDQTRDVLAGEKYWVEVLTDGSGNPQSASFIEANSPVPSDTADYKLCVEFDEDAEGRLIVIYHRFDSIEYLAGDALLPFQIYISGNNIVSAAGTVDGTGYPETVEEGPANGVWYFEVGVVINDDTGAITGTSVDWVISPSGSTSTEFYTLLGEVEVIDGAADPDTITQYNYGPMLVYAYGTPIAKWGVSIF